MRRVHYGVLLAGVCLAGCGVAAIKASSSQPVKPSLPAKQVNPVDPRWEKAVGKAAEGYQKLRKVTPELRYALSLCSMPQARVRFSASIDSSTHGSKLYWLYATNPLLYLKATEKPGQSAMPAGQTLVKESWHFAAVPPSKTDSKAGKIQTANADGVAVKEGKYYQVTERYALFVMTKLAASTPGTDSGWIYGTVDPRTNKVTAAGKVETCMSCHRQAGGGRLFGPNYHPQGSPAEKSG